MGKGDSWHLRIIGDMEDPCEDPVYTREEGSGDRKMKKAMELIIAHAPRINNKKTR